MRASKSGKTMYATCAKCKHEQDAKWDVCQRCGHTYISEDGLHSIERTYEEESDKKILRLTLDLEGIHERHIKKLEEKNGFLDHIIELQREQIEAQEAIIKNTRETEKCVKDLTMMEKAGHVLTGAITGVLLWTIINLTLTSIGM